MFHVKRPALPISSSGVRTTPLSNVGHMNAPLLTIADAAERLATSERHLRGLIYRREICFVKVGHLVRFDPNELERWIDDRKVAAE